MSKLVNEEIKNWFMSKYGILSSEEMMKEVYDEEVLKLPVVNKMSQGNPLKYVADLQPNVYSLVNVIRGRIVSETEVEVCAVCHRKNCTDPSHTGKIPLYILIIHGGDTSGMIDMSYITQHKNFADEVKVSRFLLILGKIEYKNNFKRFKILKYKILTPEQNQALSELLVFSNIRGGAGGIDKKEYDTFVANHSALNNIIGEISVMEREGRVYL